MQGWWVSDYWAVSPVLVISWVAWVIGSICLHELAHGWAAIRLGDRTPIELGHMTANPLVHMGQWSLIMFVVIGIAWGMMPVNPSRLRGKHAGAIVAAAGPAMNLLLAVVAVVVAAALQVAIDKGFDSEPVRNAAVFFFVGAALNILLMLFNLLPIPPLDGSRIGASFSPGFDRFFYSERGQYVGLALFIGVFFFGASRIFEFSFMTAAFIRDAIASPFI